MLFVIGARCDQNRKVCQHLSSFAVQRNLSDRQCFILTGDLKRTCSVHGASINQRSELSVPSYLGIDGIENEMPGNEHFVEKVNSPARAWEMRKRGSGDL